MFVNDTVLVVIISYQITRFSVKLGILFTFFSIDSNFIGLILSFVHFM